MHDIDNTFYQEKSVMICTSHTHVHMHTYTHKQSLLDSEGSKHSPTVNTPLGRGVVMWVEPGTQLLGQALDVLLVLAIKTI